MFWLIFLFSAIGALKIPALTGFMESVLATCPTSSPLGGREVAERMLEDANTKGTEQKDQVRRDTEHGRDQAPSARESGTGWSYDDQPTVHLEQSGPSGTGGTTGGTTGGSSTY